MNSYPHIERLVFGTPWAITPEMLEVVAYIVARKIDSVDIFAEAEAAAGRKLQNNVQDEPTEVIDGIGIVPISGVIMRKASMFDKVSGALSYPQIRERFQAALDNPDVKTVMLKFDSPGGEVKGLQETADAIWNARDTTNKRIVAYSDGTIASAAYWLASQADEIVASADSDIGSIGVIAKFTDTTRKELNSGEDQVVVKSGKFKGMGAGPISEEQIGVIEELVAEHFKEFTDAVVRGRSGSTNNFAMSDDIKTGRVYTGRAALKNGLVDANMTFGAALKRYASR